MSHHDFNWYKRGLLRYFEVNEINRDDRGAFVSRASPADFLRDSLLWGIEQYEAGNLKFAYRGLIEAAKDAERAGHDSITHDAWTTLKIACEDAIADLTVDRDQAIAVMQDCLEDAGQHRPYRGRR